MCSVVLVYMVCVCQSVCYCVPHHNVVVWQIIADTHTMNTNTTLHTPTMTDANTPTHPLTPTPTTTPTHTHPTTNTDASPLHRHHTPCTQAQTHVTHHHTTHNTQPHKNASDRQMQTDKQTQHVTLALSLTRKKTLLLDFFYTRKSIIHRNKLTSNISLVMRVSV